MPSTALATAHPSSITETSMSRSSATDLSETNLLSYVSALVRGGNSPKDIQTCLEARFQSYANGPESLLAHHGVAPVASKPARSLLTKNILAVSNVRGEVEWTVKRTLAAKWLSDDSLYRCYSFASGTFGLMFYLGLFACATVFSFLGLFKAVPLEITVVANVIMTVYHGFFTFSLTYDLGILRLFVSGFWFWSCVIQWRLDN